MRGRIILMVSFYGRKASKFPPSLPPSLLFEGGRAHLRATSSLLRVPAGSLWLWDSRAASVLLSGGKGGGGATVAVWGASFSEAYRLRRRYYTSADMAPSLCSTLPVIWRGGGGYGIPTPPPQSGIIFVVWYPVPYPSGYVKLGGSGGPPTHPWRHDDVPSPSRSGALAQSRDNDDEDVTPIAGADVIVNNVEDI